MPPGRSRTSLSTRIAASSSPATTATRKLRRFPGAFKTVLFPRAPWVARPPLFQALSPRSTVCICDDAGMCAQPVHVRPPANGFGVAEVLGFSAEVHPDDPAARATVREALFDHAL